VNRAFVIFLSLSLFSAFFRFQKSNSRVKEESEDLSMALGSAPLVLFFYRAETDRHAKAG
jgi:hypothetical protein